MRVLLVFNLESIMNPKPVTIGSALSEPPLSPRQPASSAFAARFQLEQPHWKAVLDHVDEAPTALLIVDLFERHPHLQAAHPAVYLRARRRKLQVQSTHLRRQKLLGACRWCVELPVRIGRAGTGLMRAAQRLLRGKREAELQWPTLIVQDT